MFEQINKQNQVHHDTIERVYRIYYHWRKGNFHWVIVSFSEIQPLEVNVNQHTIEDLKMIDHMLPIMKFYVREKEKTLLLTFNRR
jgi:hypothetical protein